MIKFVQTKNPELLFRTEPKKNSDINHESHEIRHNVPRAERRRSTDIFEISENIDNTYQSDGEFLKELESSYESSTKPVLQIPIKTPITISEEAKYDSNLDTNRTVENRDITETPLEIEKERDVSSKASVKPAKVVFKKSSAEPVSRAERANKMAHFEYIESGLNHTTDEAKQKIEHKFKMNR